MNKLTTFLAITIAALSFCLGTTMQSKAQGRGFSGVVPFVTASDHVGFFDQTNGRVFIYDSNLANCTFVGQLDNLGKPINVLAATPSNA